MVNLFSKGAREGVTTMVAVKGNRKATLNGDSTGQIIDLSEEKIYDLDLKNKTYKVTTFGEIRKQMEEAKRRAEQAAKEERAAEAQPAVEAGREGSQRERIRSRLRHQEYERDEADQRLRHARSR